MYTFGLIFSTFYICPGQIQIHQIRFSRLCKRHKYLLKSKIRRLILIHGKTTFNILVFKVIVKNVLKNHFLRMKISFFYELRFFKNCALPAQNFIARFFELKIRRKAQLMSRLNSGNFRIFEPSEWNLNLNSSDCRASKIIYNDTKLEPISWELNLKNPLFNFCVGVPEFNLVMSSNVMNIVTRWTIFYIVT